MHIHSSKSPQGDLVLQGGEELRYFGFKCRNAAHLWVFKMVEIEKTIELDIMPLTKTKSENLSELERMYKKAC